MVTGEGNHVAYYPCLTQKLHRYLF